MKNILIVFSLLIFTKGFSQIQPSMNLGLLSSKKINIQDVYIGVTLGFTNSPKPREDNMGGILFLGELSHSNIITHKSEVSKLKSISKLRGGGGLIVSNPENRLNSYYVIMGGFNLLKSGNKDLNDLIVGSAGIRIGCRYFISDNFALTASIEVETVYTLTDEILYNGLMYKNLRGTNYGLNLGIAFKLKK